MSSIAATGLIGLRSSKLADALLLSCLVIYTVGFLAIHKATNICFFMILLLAIAHRIGVRPEYRLLSHSRPGLWLMAAFVAPFAAVALTKLLRWELSYRDLDAESRYLVGIVFLVFFMVKRVSLARILEVTLPLALIATFVTALLNPAVTHHWGGRYATFFVDPNVLGSYAAIMSFMTLMTLSSPTRASSWLIALKVVGIGAGLWVTLFAASRGGWLGVVPMFLLWMLFHFRSHKRAASYSAAFVFVVIFSGIFVSPNLQDRLAAPVNDVAAWMDGSNKETAPGQRLSIWKLSLEVVLEKPLTGWGIPEVRERLTRSPQVTQWIDDKLVSSSGEYGGAHNDALQMMIVSGVWGLLAYLLIIFVPLVFFLGKRLKLHGEARLACELGACLVLGVMVCGLTNELLSLKYLASFYSITVSGLAAQALTQQTLNQSSLQA